MMKWAERSAYELGIEAPSPRLGVLFAGLGAVATTTIAGIAINRRVGRPLTGSVVEEQRIRVGTGAERMSIPLRQLLPFAPLDSLVFGAWDPIPDNGYEAAAAAGVLRSSDLALADEELRRVRPMPAVFAPSWVKRLEAEASNVKPECAAGAVARELIAQLRMDIIRFKRDHDLDRVVVVWSGSTEASNGAIPYSLANEVENSELFLDNFKHPLGVLPPSMMYARAAMAENCPFFNASPNHAIDTPLMLRQADEWGVPVAGKDLKTGQTMMKTVLAPALLARSLGLNGWFSTNILGNRDGQVLDDPDSFRTKEESKLGVLSSILNPDQYPLLYGGAYHKVRIEYYPPRGDEKEGWDNIDIFGWLGYPMQIKVNFLCRDSILAAPLVLDLILLLDLAHRAGLTGIQDWLSFYFKSPTVRPGAPVEHDLFIQHRKLKNRLRILGGQEPLTHAEEE